MSAGTLFVVATPLGNLEDLSHRAGRILREVDLVAAEDTRRARVLLGKADAHPRLLSYHAHSPPARRTELLAALAEGRNVALLTDAGTPTISDPGVALIREARAAGVRVVAVPGPSAVTAALSISGLPADRYSFMGFSPRKGAARHRLLQQAAHSPWTVVFFEAPSRVASLLEDLAGLCDADREAAVARELTKVHEEVKLGTLNDLAVYYREHPPRGEVTVLVAGAAVPRASANRAELRSRAAALLARGISRRDAAAQLAAEFDCSRNEAYRLVSEL